MPQCQWEGEDCPDDATRRVRMITSAGDTTADLCGKHATLAVMYEREWDDAEREYLEQP